MKCLWVLALGAACAVGAFGQGLPSGGVREFPAYKVYPGALNGREFPLDGARLCTVEAKAHCYKLAPQFERIEKSELSYRFGLRPKSQRINLSFGGSVVLFNANCGGGSGSSDRYVLLRSDPDGRLNNLLPQVIVSNQADVSMWDISAVSPMPVLLTADFIWEGMEAHYGAHFFEVRMYVYDPATDRYKLSHKYRTAHKYPGVDNWESQPEVLEKERGRIIEVLGAK